MIVFMSQCIFLWKLPSSHFRYSCFLPSTSVLQTHTSMTCLWYLSLNSSSEFICYMQQQTKAQSATFPLFCSGTYKTPFTSILCHLLGCRLFLPVHSIKYILIVNNRNNNNNNRNNKRWVNDAKCLSEKTYAKIRDEFEFTQPASISIVDVNEGTCIPLLETRNHCSYTNTYLFDCPQPSSTLSKDPLNAKLIQMPAV